MNQNSYPPQGSPFHFTSVTPMSQNTTPPKPRHTYSKLDALFAWLMCVLGFLFIRILPHSKNPIGATLTIWLLFVLGGIYLRKSINARMGARHYLVAAVAALLAVVPITNGNNAVSTWVSILVFCLYLAWLYDVGGLAGKKLRDQHLASHLFNAVFRLPLSFLYAFFPASGTTFSGSKGNRNFWKTVGGIGLGLSIAIIPTLIVGLLLSYDAQFRSLFSSLFSFSPKGIATVIGECILGFPIALLLFGALFSVKARRKINDEEAPLDLSGARVAPRALLCAAVTPILCLYVLFFISQWDYYLSAFTHTLPDGLTYAAYAREGFFQLCTVCVINAILLSLFHLLMKRDENNEKRLMTRIYSALISISSLILIATAFSKMLLYIDSYGLTPKRVYTSWFMLLLALIFVTVLLRQFFKRIPCCSIIVIGTLLLVALIAIPNTNATIAEYNADAYISGKISEIDIETLDSLGDSAVPVMVKLENELEGRTNRTDKENAVLEDLSIRLDRIEKETKKQDLTLFSFSIPKYQAHRAIKQR